MLQPAERGANGPADDGKTPVTRGRHPALSRREFLLWGGQALSLVALAGLIRLGRRREDLLLPPGALPFEAFLSRCLRCQQCLEVCPTGAITSVLLTETVLGAGTPRLDFSRGYCSLCLKCVATCPTGALAPIEKGAIQLGFAQVDRQNCVAWLWGGCTRCYRACPSGAIVLDEMQRPLVDVNRCNGCGLCEYVCISTAVRSYISTRGKGIVVRPMTETGVSGQYLSHPRIPSPSAHEARGSV